MALRRLKLSMHRDHAMEATRVSIGKSKLVYVLAADKKIKYDLGKSRIAYIGTTKKVQILLRLRRQGNHRGTLVNSPNKSLNPDTRISRQLLRAG